ncbi:hypothetical protein D4R87_01190 [bacterium]|nr:MAG: hypothetical protein D4R87_01190 [bacterium]
MLKQKVVSFAVSYGGPRENSHIRKLGKSGGSTSISLTIPIDIIRNLKWRDNQKVVVKQYGKGVLIKDWKPKE